jgi:hypothetical protein
LHDSGLREHNNIEETTAQQTKDGGMDDFRNTLKRSMGGVLFIDEVRLCS